MEELKSALSSDFPKMDDEQFEIWSDLLEDRTGMRLQKERRSFLETSIGLRMKEISITTYSDYYVLLLNGTDGAEEWQTLVDRLTIHETRFFRHMPSIHLLEKIILPALFNAKCDKNSLKIWSAGCSTGEETYTLAMIAMDYIQSGKTAKEISAGIKDCYLSVTGMDISIPAMITAREAVYARDRIRHIPAQYIRKYLKFYANDRYRIIDALRKKVCFVPFNIVDIKNEMVEQMDIIFCQNVLIYFDRERRRKIIKCLLKRLKPDGYLVLGAGETSCLQHPELERIDYPNTLAFRKK